MRLSILIFLCVFSALVAERVVANQKQELPSEQEQTAAQKTIDSIYKTEIRAARSAPQKAKLAKKLIDSAKASNDLANRYALYLTAIELYTDGDLHHRAIETANDLGEDFSIDIAGMKNQILSDSSSARVDAYGRYLLSFEYEDAVFAALSEGKREQAEELAEHAEKSAKKSRNKKLIEQAEALVEGVEELEKLADSIEQARETLKSNPDDPAANEALGKYVSLIEQNWAEGWLLLEKGSSEKLKEIATQELAPTPDALKLGDNWWEQAEAMQGIFKRSAKRRAVHWYKQIAPTLTGLEKKKIDQRLAHFVPAIELKGEPAIPTKFSTKVARDRHKGMAGSTLANTARNIYFLDMRIPQELNGLRLRYNAQMSRLTGSSQGTVAVSLDGETWIDVGEWTTESCRDANKYADWSEIAIETTGTLTVDRLAVRFSYIGGSERLQMTEVDLVR